MHDYIMLQQNAKANWESLEALLPATDLQCDAISPNMIDPAKKKTRKKFKEMCISLKKQEDDIMVKAFTLHQHMSGPALRAKWNNIASKHCFTL